MTILDESTRTLLDAPNFAVVATLTASGAPHTSTVWYLRDGDAILISVTADKLKARNLARDPRISLTVSDRGNPYHSVDLRGTAELVDDPEKTLPARLAERYLGDAGANPPEPAEIKRLIVRVTPAKVTAFKV
ncbi:PPOX class F420-dependent oxidoreductase [Virgisporangium ochraceum]|uniref:PPOX class F420-dependent enzyme n=1 Tax=Virgisporangium ochraceum TaxID=65505 RepID=A0A8J3ZLN6_9ACTN|nr:PPOX class F420-dependent oxidoreductase [Virgisporangium ochraceum]GIJ66589.1 PPOX class F420-dependent enzyme [Virgisporangium ochraceum]